MRGDKVAPGTDQLGGGAMSTVEVQPFSDAPKSWWTRIDEAEKRGHFTREDNDLASDWLDCACGQQDPRIPRWTGKESDFDTQWNEVGEPRDGVLMNFGFHFMTEVAGNHFADARHTLRAIEDRSALLLHELGYSAAADASANQEAPAAPLTLNADEHSEERCTCGQLTPWNCEGDCGGGK